MRKLVDHCTFSLEGLGDQLPGNLEAVWNYMLVQAGKQYVVKMHCEDVKEGSDFVEEKIKFCIVRKRRDNGRTRRWKDWKGRKGKGGEGI